MTLNLKWEGSGAPLGARAGIQHRCVLSSACAGSTRADFAATSRGRSCRNDRLKLTRLAAGRIESGKCVRSRFLRGDHVVDPKVVDPKLVDPKGCPSMMRSIVSSSLRSRGVIVVLGVAVFVLGILQLDRMPKDAMPEFSPTIVEVQTEAPGLSAQEVEQLITTPLEQDLLNGVAFLDSIRSESVPGLSRIEMIFQSGTDVPKPAKW